MHPAMEAVGWILAGAGIGSLAVVAVTWALMRVISIDDSAPKSFVMSGEGAAIVLVPPRETNVPGLGM
jgi:hypothetical protein